MPYIRFQQFQTAFMDTYQSIKELLRAGAWDKEIANMLLDDAKVGTMLPQWKRSRQFEAEATPQDVCRFYDNMVLNMPDPSAYTPLLSELFFALQWSQGVKVPLSHNPRWAGTARDKTAIRLPQTHRFGSSPPPSEDHRSEHSSTASA